MHFGNLPESNASLAGNTSVEISRTSSTIVSEPKTPRATKPAHDTSGMPNYPRIQILARRLKPSIYSHPLPKELCLMIWKLALSDPRVLDLRLREHHGDELRPHINHIQRGAWAANNTSSPRPITLDVCYESRKVALTSYERARICQQSGKERKSV
jgi:hypothetical protein